MRKPRRPALRSEPQPGRPAPGQRPAERSSTTARTEEPPHPREDPCVIGAAAGRGPSSTCPPRPPLLARARRLYTGKPGGSGVARSRGVRHRRQVYRRSSSGWQVGLPEGKVGSVERLTAHYQRQEDLLWRAFVEESPEIHAAGQASRLSRSSCGRPSSRRVIAIRRSSTSSMPGVVPRCGRRGNPSTQRRRRARPAVHPAT